MSQPAMIMTFAVDCLREDPHRADEIAASWHIARSTIWRWDHELRHQELHPHLPRRREALEKNLQDIELFVQESAAMLRLAGHYDLKTAQQLDRRLGAHQVSIILFNLLTILASFIPAALIALVSLTVSIYATGIGGEPVGMGTRWLISAVGSLIGLAYAAISGSGLLLLFRWFAPFRQTIAAVSSAERDIGKLGGRDPFRGPLSLDIFRLGGDESANSLRRHIQRKLVAAERQLTRKTVLGSGYATITARNIELQARRRAAATLAWVEMTLVREGCESYDQAQRVLRQLGYITLLRDWALVDLPRPDEAAEAFRSISRRMWRGSLAAVSFAATITTVIVALPGLLRVVELLPNFP